MITAESVLKQFWGYETFRSPQDKVVDTVLGGQDCLVLLPTGGGKSICFQVPALMREGICIVVSPLIALMKDQVEGLRRKGVKAAAIYAGMKKMEIDILLDNCIYGNYKFLYVSPERLQSPLFLERARKMRINFLAIDEAHCISQWGYDFRPAYLDILSFKNTLTDVPTIALTASATAAVREDIIEQLRLEKPVVYKASFARENLSYAVFEVEDKLIKILEILNKVAGSAIVYCRNRRTTEELTALLKRQGIAASYYHGGLQNELRAVAQQQWLSNKVRVMVSTNAFGMGIDKPDVRLVIHYDLPDSVEAYYQEAGRAGRDGNRSFAVLLYQSRDLERQRELLMLSYPSIAEISKTYQCLANYFKLAVGSGQLVDFDFDIEHFAQVYGLNMLNAYNCIKKLELEGLVLYNEHYHRPSRLMFTMSKQEVYQFQLQHENFDLLIKSLLRLYGGDLFHGYVNLQFDVLSRLCGLSVSDIRAKLVYLSEHKMIDYVPANQKPQLSFVTPRLDASKLGIDVKRLNERKAVALLKSDAMQRFVLGAHSCRTRFIQSYFDEISFDLCGKCDVCLRYKKTVDFDLKVSEIKTEITALDRMVFPIAAEELNMKLKVAGHFFTEAIRQLIEEGTMRLSLDGLLVRS